MFTVPLASNGLSEAAVEAALGVLKSGQLTMGVQVKTFEAAMAAYLGVKHFVMVNSGSSANLVMIESLVRPSNSIRYLQAGDKVVVPAIAWPTTVWPLVQLGLRPFFADVDEKTLGIDLEKLETVLSTGGHGIKAIFAINALGSPLDETKLASLAKRFGLTLIVDNCESLGSHWNGVHSGQLATMSSYSFYFSHHMTTMEGGGVATDSDEIANDLRSMRSHGWSRDRSDSDVWSEMGRPEDNKFLFVTTGYNVRPMEIQAAIGLTELPNLEGYIGKRRLIASAAKSAVSGSEISLIGSEYEASNPGVRHSWMMLPFYVSEESRISRADSIKILNDLGIETRPILTGNFVGQPAVRRLFPDLIDKADLQVAERVSERGFMIGCHQDFSDNQVAIMTESLAKLAARSLGK